MSVLKTYGDDTDSFKPSLTWRIKDGHMEGMIDGIEAVAQAVDLMLSTERYQFDIFSSDYGLETSDLIGRHRELIRGDLQRRIEECLAEDDRVTGVSDFDILFSGETATATFTVNTIFGDIPEERSVTIV